MTMFSKRTRKLSKADETSEFIEFWELWRPHARETDGRGMAREAFFKHVSEGAEPRDIVDGARWFIRNLKDPRFIPMSQTWLNRGAYEDLADKERDWQKLLQEKQQKETNVVSMHSQPPKSKFLVEWERKQAEKVQSNG